MFLVLMVLAAIFFLIGAATAAKFLLVVGLVCLLVGLVCGVSTGNHRRKR